MAKAKKKLLPKDFDALLKAGDLDALKAVFDSCDVNARGGYTKATALAFRLCPDALTRWLVEQGADISAVDTYGETPLHAQAGHRGGCVGVLLELGADVHAGEATRGTPLHKAADRRNLDSARLLLEHGARADARNGEGRMPLEYALQRCGNGEIQDMAPMAELLLETAQAQAADNRSFVDRLLGRGGKRGGPVTPEMKASVVRIGTNFEFHRAGFNPDYLEATNAALERLYVLFEVPPVPRRAMHDGKSPIVARAARWEERHQELWELLVPSKGAADTVQGEIVRISGRISDEIEGNGGVNWDGAYRKMADAFLTHVGSGTPVPALDEAKQLVSEVRARRGDTRRLCELAVEWVALNPKPVKLPPPDYAR